MFLSQLITIATIHLLAVISPGPDFAMVTRNSLIYSRRIGVYTSVGLAFGIAMHITYSLLGIGLLISQSILLFNTIKYVGAGYLIYIGYKSLKTKPEYLNCKTEQKKGVSTQGLSTESKNESMSIFSAIKIGFLTNVLNPKATLFMLALFTQVISFDTPKAWQLVYGLEMSLVTFAWFSLVSFFFSNEKIKHKIQKYKHYIERLTGGVLIALGIKVALASKK